MTPGIVRLPGAMDVSAAESLAGDPEWVPVEDGDGDVLRLLKAGLARHLRSTNEKEAHLMHLSAERKATLGIDIDATRENCPLAPASRCSMSVDALSDTPSQRGPR